MAGYSNKREVKKYSRLVAEHYGENYIEVGYRPLREFRFITPEGKEEKKPVILFILERLFDSDFIDEIVIVGHRMLLEEKLGAFIHSMSKPCQIINQNSRIPGHVADAFRIQKKDVKYNSFTGNAIKAYGASKAYLEKNHALFVASDSPMTTESFIEQFLLTIREYDQSTAIFVPAVFVGIDEDRLGRKPLLLVNDTDTIVSEIKDEYGRQGFRLSSLLFANPFLFDVNTMNTAYNLRKFLSPKVQFQLYRITRALDYSNIYSKYFIRKDLTIRECEEITTRYFNGPVKSIPMLGEAATYDYDGTEKEFKGISRMLSRRGELGSDKAFSDREKLF
jgi:hypothetical protein